MPSARFSVKKPVTMSSTNTYTSPLQTIRSKLSNSSRSHFVLVTGATGFIGAHVVDTLLARGIRVRGATRSLSKGKAMADARPQHASMLEFVQIQDFENPDGLVDAVKGVNGVIHVASVRKHPPFWS